MSCSLLCRRGFCGGSSRLFLCLCPAGLDRLFGCGLRRLVAVLGGNDLAVSAQSLEIGGFRSPVRHGGKAVFFQDDRFHAGFRAGNDDIALCEDEHDASPFSDAVHVQDGGGIEQLHLGNVGHVRGVIADIGDVWRGHDAAHGHQLIHLDVAGLVDVAHHAVTLTGACTLAPAAAADEQLTTILDSGVVLHQEVVDGLGCQIGHHGGQDVAVLLIRQQDVVGDGIGVILAGSPHSAQQVVHVLQDLLRGLILPLGRGGARTIAGSSGLGDIGDRKSVV